jgi:hypothetical protein
MSWAAVRGGMTKRIIPATTSNNHTKRGIRARVIPWQRIQKTVVTMLMLVATLPMPPTSRLRIQ